MCDSSQYICLGYHRHRLPAQVKFPLALLGKLLQFLHDHFTDEGARLVDLVLTHGTFKVRLCFPTLTCLLLVPTLSFQSFLRLCGLLGLLKCRILFNPLRLQNLSANSETHLLCLLLLLEVVENAVPLGTRGTLSVYDAHCLPQRRCKLSKFPVKTFFWAHNPLSEVNHSLGVVDPHVQTALGSQRDHQLLDVVPRKEAGVADFGPTEII